VFPNDILDTQSLLDHQLNQGSVAEELARQGLLRKLHEHKNRAFEETTFSLVAGERIDLDLRTPLAMDVVRELEDSVLLFRGRDVKATVLLRMPKSIPVANTAFLQTGMPAPMLLDKPSSEGVGGIAMRRILSFFGRPQIANCVGGGLISATPRSKPRLAIDLMKSWIAEDRGVPDAGSLEQLKAELDRDRSAGSRLFP